MRVESVLIVCRNRSTEEYDVFYKVGVNGVSEIQESGYSPEPYCGKSMFTVFDGDKRIAVITEPDVVTYFKTNPDQQEG